MLFGYNIENSLTSKNKFLETWRVRMKMTLIGTSLSVLAALMFTGCSGGGSSSSKNNSTDDVAPVVTLIGDANVTQNFGHYVDAGATAEDDIDGDVTASITVSPKLNSESDAGTYTVVYTAKDAAGNEGTTTRIVTINPCQNYNPITGGCEDPAL